MNRLQLISVILLAAGAVSCSKEGSTAHSPGVPLELVPSSAGSDAATKGAVSSGPLDGEYTILLSAWFNNATAGESSGNYFRGRHFTKSGDGRWAASPALWWPLGGSLDFLALALKDTLLGNSAVWHPGNVAKGVELAVPDRSCLDTEIMFSRSESRTVSGGAVSLSFSHAQAWISFEFARYEPGTIRLDSLVIRKPYLGGTLRLESGVYLESGWDFHGFFKKDYTLPQSRNVLFSNPPTVIDILLPEQQACELEIWYTQRPSASVPWGEGVCHVAGAIADPWHAGTKTTYTMIIRKKLEISTAVSFWDEQSRPISIN